MNALATKYYNCKVSEKDGALFIHGRTLQWTVWLPLCLWGMFCVAPLLERGNWHFVLLSFLVTLAVTLFMALSYSYEIIISKSAASFKLKFFFITYRNIKVPPELFSIGIGCPIEVYTHGLMFDYSEGWNNEKASFSVQYKNKEIFLQPGCDEFIWNSMKSYAHSQQI